MLIVFCVLRAGLISSFGQPGIKYLHLIQLCLCVSQCKPPAEGTGAGMERCRISTGLLAVASAISEA